MTYRVKEIFATLQGEGAQAGRAAVFCRFSGCNLWTGREEHRTNAVCRFCDTDFVGTDGPGGGRFTTAELLAAAIERSWPSSGKVGRFVVCTGGEPLLQLDAELIGALHVAGFEVAVETNGTRPLPAGIDWVCVSPKAGAELVVDRADEVKLVVRQEGISPADVDHIDSTYWFLQPMDGPDLTEHTNWAIDYCLSHPKWRLSAQTHKMLGIP
ncbi:MAG: 7-carboxy-7-deazaguanine synthase [Microthrixaceae bacterium]|nr:7-carboxy-7-deazaguanine synthase [Microthrixaceae bacterium]